MFPSVDAFLFNFYVLKCVCVSPSVWIHCRLYQGPMFFIWTRCLTLSNSMLTRIALTCTLPVLSLWSSGITGSQYTLSLKYKNVHGENGEEGDQWRQEQRRWIWAKYSDTYTCMKMSLWNPLFCMQKIFVKNN